MSINCADRKFRMLPPIDYDRQGRAHDGGSQLPLPVGPLGVRLFRVRG